jgi:hypothetical protein
MFAEIDTKVIKVVVLKEEAGRWGGVKGRRCMRCGGYRIIRP